MKKEKLPRSPYELLHGLVYLARMLDKIRLHAEGKLSEDYIPNLGIKLDDRCLRFLGVAYDALVTTVKAGATDEEVWGWCQQQGKQISEEEIHIWNQFMIKYGWRDEATEILQRRLKEGGWEDRADIQTIFDYIDLDEGHSF